MPAVNPNALVCFPTEGRGLIASDYWRGGPHALLLVSTVVADQSPWAPITGALVAHGLTLLEPTAMRVPDPGAPEAIERLARIVAGGVAYLRSEGAAAVSILAAGHGATAAGEAVLSGLVGNIHTLVLLAPPAMSGPLGCIAERVVFVVADEDEATELAITQRTQAPHSTQLTILTGDHKAEDLPTSPHADALVRVIREALPGMPD